MACLALSLQPANGADILLQTREWFPPARALAALSAFRQTRLAFSPAAAGPSRHHPPPPPTSQSDDLDPSALGDDPLAASSGQVVVGVESKYRVVYRLVNGIYVLGVTTTDESDGRSNNVFECINTVNQAVSVVVAACRGVDVTPEKLHRKYPEIYMALDIVLRGVGSVRLAAILSSIHGDNIAKMVHTAVEVENRVRGAETWSGGAEALSVERQANRDSFSSAYFELPAETLAAGDEVAATIAPAAPEDQLKDQASLQESTEEKDPFAASEKINKPEEALLEGLSKGKELALVPSDPAAALAGLEVAPLPHADATKPTDVKVEGFEGVYGGIEYGKETSTITEDFEGFDNAFGGGLDPSEFLTTTKKARGSEGLGGLEFLGTSDAPKPAVAAGAAGTPLENLLVTKKPEMTTPEMYISEVINAEFKESLLARVGLQGTIFLRTLPPKQSAGKETEFSFRLEGTSSIKRAVMQSSCVSSLGNGMFHIRSPPKEEAIIIMKYSLQPRLTPIPLRVRLLKRRSGTMLSVMIQYASNPELAAPLNDVTFILKLPVDPSVMHVSPRAVLNRDDRELRWHVAEIPLKGNPGRLRAKMHIDEEVGEGSELKVVGMVKFSAQGATTLSGVCLRPVSEGVERLINHLHENRIPMCIGTGSDKQRFELLTQKHGAVFSKIHHVVAGDDPEVKNGKPSPDIFLTASERYEDNVEPSKILVFEDAPSGVAAAKSAGMWVIKLPSPEMDAVYHNDADQTLSSLVDFQPENWGLPPFQDVDL